MSLGHSVNFLSRSPHLTCDKGASYTHINRIALPVKALLIPIGLNQFAKCKTGLIKIWEWPRDEANHYYVPISIL